MRSLGGPVAVASIALVLATAVIGNGGQARKEDDPLRFPKLASTRNAFEREGSGGKEVVLVRPMVESDASVWLRARRSQRTTWLTPGKVLWP